MSVNTVEMRGTCKCGHTLTSINQFGNALICPACGALMYIKDDLKLSTAEELFWLPTISREEAVGYGIYLSMNTAKCKRKKITDVSCELKWVPTIEVKTESGFMRFPLAKDSQKWSVDWNSFQLQIRDRKLKSDLGHGNQQHIFPTDPDSLSKLVESFGEKVSPVIKFAPIIVWSAHVRNISIELFIDATRPLPTDYIHYHQELSKHIINFSNLTILSLLGWVIEIAFWGVAAYLIIGGFVHKSGLELCVFLLFSSIILFIAFFVKAFIQMLINRLDKK